MTYDKPMVECKKCRAQFPYSGSETQGYGCASVLYKKDGKWFIHGHYGSRLFDMSIYRIIDNGEPWDGAPTEPMNPICDICIDVWNMCGRLSLVRGNVL